MYMSYCRFEGTYREMDVCLNEVEEHVNEEGEYNVSEREIDFFRTIVRRMAEFMQEMELLDEDGYVREDMLDVICEAMRKPYEE